MRFLLFLASATFLLTAQGCSKEPVLSRISYGDVVFGTSLKTVEDDLHEQAIPEFFDDFCMFVTFATYPGARFMIEQGSVTRVDVDPDIPNSLGVAAGQSLSEVQAQYPDVRITPHKYDPLGHYLIFASEDGKCAIVMETSGDKIAAIRAGLNPAVHYVEGCR